MTQLYYLPNENRVLTHDGLVAEIEYIGREYCGEWIIDDLIDAGSIIELSSDDPKAADAEPEERTILVAKLFAEMICHEDVMREWNDDERAFLDNLRDNDDEILRFYESTFLMCDL